MKKHKWTKKLVFFEALKYKTKSEFQKGSSGAYKAAVRMGILDEVRSHMPRNNILSGSQNPLFKWSYEALKEESLKYKTKSEFQKGSNGAYTTALKKDILEEICRHMPIYTKIGKTNPNFVWSDENIQKEALKYDNKKDFKIGSRGAYEAAVRRNSLNKVCSHMTRLQKRWSEMELIEEALKYESKSEFESNNPSAYNSARTRGLLNKISKHMKRPRLSSQEREILYMVLALFPSAISLRDMKVNINGKPHIKGFDIDVYVPELKKGIEFDGTWIHSFEGLKRSREHWPKEDIKNYHKLKDDWFISKGIQVLHIKEEDWYKHKEDCTEKIWAFLKKTS